MHILRRGGSGLLLALFQVLLLVFPVITALALLLHSPDSIRQTVKDSGAYDKLVPALLDQSVEQVAKEGDQQAVDLLKEPGIRDAVAESFKPGQIEYASNQAIDGFYAWLQGKTPTPEFTIDLTPSRQAFIDNMNQYALERAKSLPVCNLQQLRQTQPNESVLDTPCLPPGVTPQAAANQLTQEAVSDSEFLAKPVISSKDLKGADGQPAFAAANWLPEAYKWLMRAPWILGGLILLTGAGAILLHEERWRAMRHAAIALLVTGILFSLGFVAYWLFFANIDRLITGVTADVQAIISKMMATTFGSYVRTVSLTGGAYAVLGAAGLIASRVMKPKAAAPATQPVPGTPAAPAAQPTTPDTTTPTTEVTTTKEDETGTPPTTPKA